MKGASPSAAAAAAFACATDFGLPKSNPILCRFIPLKSTTLLARDHESERRLTAKQEEEQLVLGGSRLWCEW